MPSGNISLDYDEIQNVSNAMRQAATDIVPHLESTRTKVEGLLDNGLYMQQSSPAMKDSYQKLTTSLTQAIDNINQFAKQFDEIKKNIEKLDTDVATSTKKNS